MADISDWGFVTDPFPGNFGQSLTLPKKRTWTTALTAELLLVVFCVAWKGSYTNPFDNFDYNAKDPILLPQFDLYHVLFQPYGHRF